MGWFARVEKVNKNLMETDLAPDKDNPYSRNIEDEGEIVTIVHTRNIESLEEEEEDDSTSN